MMKGKLLFCAGLLMAIACGVGMQSCKSEKKVEPLGKIESELVVVERQTVSMPVTDYYSVDLSVDVPISGQQVVVDSLMVFLNKQLYDFCEHEVNSSGMTMEELATNDAKHLLQHYFDAYKDYIKKEVDWFFSFGLTMIAQTESYVTYATSCSHCGASCGSELYFYTLSKIDGHRLSPIMTQEEFKRFHKEQLKNEDDSEPFLPDYATKDYFFALLEDNLVFALNGYGNHFLSEQFKYEDIRPYLSSEAQAYIDARGDKANYPLREWYMGHVEDVVKNADGDSIYLIKRDGEYYIEDFLPNYVCDFASQFLTCKREGGKYVPIEVLKTADGMRSSIDFRETDSTRVIPHHNDDYVKWDEGKKELRLAFVMEPNIIPPRIFHFDGRQFVEK